MRSTVEIIFGSFYGSHEKKSRQQQVFIFSCTAVPMLASEAMLFLPQSAGAMPAHRSAIRDALITLFEIPVPEDNSVGRTVLTRMLGPSPIDFAGPIFKFRGTASIFLP